MANPGRAVASIGLAFVVFLLGLMVLTGAPIWYLTLRYGSQAVEDSPGGGGAIVIGTAPIAAAISLIAAIILGVRFYYRSDKKPKPAKKSRQEDA